MEHLVTSTLESQMFCWLILFFLLCDSWSCPILVRVTRGRFPQWRLGFRCASFSLSSHGHQLGWKYNQSLGQANNWNTSGKSLSMFVAGDRKASHGQKVTSQWFPHSLQRIIKAWGFAPALGFEWKKNLCSPRFGFQWASSPWGTWGCQTAHSHPAEMAPKGGFFHSTSLCCAPSSLRISRYPEKPLPNMSV